MNEAKKINTWVEGEPSPYQLRDITHFPDWHNLIVWDAFFNNLTAGLMIVTALAWFCGPPVFTMLLPIPLTIALALVLIDLVILILDLADPPRFIHSLRVMRFTSALSVGVWGLTSYATFLAFAVLFSWLYYFIGEPASIGGLIILMVTNVCAVMALIGAIVVICYKGVVFSCSSQPGVCEARWLTPFMVSDSLLMGLSVYILITLVFVGYTLPVLSLMGAFIGLIIIRSIAFALLWTDVKNRARLIFSKSGNLVICLIIYALGGLIAIGLVFCEAPGLCIAAIISLCVGVCERYWLIALPRPVNLAPTLK